MYIFEVIIKSIINSIILFEQLKFKIAQIDQNGVNLIKTDTVDSCYKQH